MKKREFVKKANGLIRFAQGKIKVEARYTHSYWRGYVQALNDIVEVFE